MSDFQKIAPKIHKTAVEKGFWNEPGFWDQIGNKLALVHSEVTEILEALRKGQGPEKVADEFADVIIRLIDLHKMLAAYGEVDEDLWAAVEKKVEVNAGRPALHGNVFG